MECVVVRLLSQGVDLFALKFYLDRVSPINHSWHQKTRDNGLPDSGDPHPSAFPHFDIILECDGQTDRQTNRRICHSIYIALMMREY